LISMILYESQIMAFVYNAVILKGGDENEISKNAASWRYGDFDKTRTHGDTQAADYTPAEPEQGLSRQVITINIVVSI